MVDVRSLLVSAVERLDEERALCLFKEGLERGLDPIAMIEDVRKGMERVGDLYNRGTYYIADLIMASLIFKGILDLLPLSNENSNGPSPVVFGTVRDDIHDIGKNLTAGLLRARGVGVCDLGVDVLPEQFVRAVTENNAKIVAMSGLLTSSYKAMNDTVVALKEAGLRKHVKVVIGGLVNEKVSRYVGADYWCRDCSEGVFTCLEILGRVKPVPVLAAKA